jgi:putative PIN family toxin of toxin-antitoxin system
VKAVLDTNVLIAAFLTEGVCAKLLVRARVGEYDLVLSADILREFQDVLYKKFHLSRSEIADVVTILTEATKEILQQVDPIKRLSRDPDDDKILACAHEVGADYIVTGDEDLLVIKEYGGTPIVTPRDFEDLFRD